MPYFFHNNIQRGILYLAKSDANFYTQVAPLIQPEYFEYPSYSKIYEIIKTHYIKYLKLPNNAIILDEARKSLKENEEIIDYEDDLINIDNIDVSS